MPDPNVVSQPAGINPYYGYAVYALVTVLGAVGAQRLVPGLFKLLSTRTVAHQADIDNLRAELKAQTAGIIAELREQIADLEKQNGQKELRIGELESRVSILQVENATCKAHLEYLTRGDIGSHIKSLSAQNKFQAERIEAQDKEIHELKTLLG